MGDSRPFGAVVVVGILLVGLALAIPAVINKRPDPPSLQDADTAGREYARILASGDLEAYRDSVEHVLGVTIDDAFRVERGCLDWNSATVSVEPHPVASYMAVVTFSDGSSSVARDFQWTVARDPLFLAGRWIPTVDADCSG